MEPDDPMRERAWREAATPAGALVAAAIGTIAVVGWNTGSERLVEIQSGTMPVQYNTALGFLVCALSLLALMRNRKGLATIAAGSVFLLAAATGVEILAGSDSGIDTIFFQGMVNEHVNGRMAPNTVASFLCIAAALLLLVWRSRARATAVSLAAFVAAVALVALTGYIAAIPSAYQWRGGRPIAALTTIAFLGLSAGTIAAGLNSCNDQRRSTPRWLPAPVFVFLMSVCIMISESLWDTSRITVSPQARHSLVLAMILVAIFGIAVCSALVAVLRMAQAAHVRSRELEKLNKVLDVEAKRSHSFSLQLEAERRRFEDVLNALPAYVILISPDYQVPFANRFFEERFGKAEGRPCFEYLFQRSAPCENCESFKVLQTKQPHQWEWRGPDGRNYDIHDFLFHDASGTLILETGSDITERKAAEAELKRLNRALRMVSECNHAIAHANQENELLQAICELAVTTGGYRLAWVGFAQDDAAKTVRVVAKAGAAVDYVTDGFVTWADEPRGRGPTGTAIRGAHSVTSNDMANDESLRPWRERLAQFGLRSSMVIPLLQDGRALGALSLYSAEANAFEEEEQALFRRLVGDLTFGIESIRTRQARERAEERIRFLASIVDSTDDAIYSKSLEGVILSWNPGAVRLYGYEAGEVVGKNIRLLDPEISSREMEELLTRLSQGESVDHIEARRRRKDGTIVDVSMTLSPVRDRAGRVIAACSIARDISERKRAEAELRRFTEELKRSNAELQEFAFVASHDLQEPLRKITAFSERLRERSAGQLDEMNLDFLNRMHNAATRMSGLIESLLEYSRVATRGVPFVEVDLAQAMLGVLVDLEQRIRESHAEVVVGRLPKVSGDPTQLRQLLQNLVANALKFHAPGTPPRVAIRSSSKEGRWEITVSDAGIGFAPEYAEKIFRPFQRLHARTEYEGSGMGLAICRKIAQRHGSTITVQSQPGEGSVFTVSLPALRERTEPCLERQSVSSSPRTMTTITC